MKAKLHSTPKATPDKPAKSPEGVKADRSLPLQPGPISAETVLQMQQVMGNRAVQRFLARYSSGGTWLQRKGGKRRREIAERLSEIKNLLVENSRVATWERHKSALVRARTAKQDYTNQAKEAKTAPDPARLQELDEQIAAAKATFEAFEAASGTSATFDALVDETKRLRTEAEGLGADNLVEQANQVLRWAVRYALHGDKRPDRPTLENLARDYGVPITRPHAIDDPGAFPMPAFTSVTAAIETDVPGHDQSDRAKRTADRTETDGNVDGQITTLLGKVDEAYMHYLLQKANGGGELLGVFLGPEWYFGMVKIYTRAQKQLVIERIVAASRQYPNMLIVPGTILWTPDGKNIMNTAPVIINGTLHKEVVKLSWGGDASRREDFIGMVEDEDTKKKKMHSKRSKFVRPGQDSGLFQIGNVSFALDICQDHFQARAKADYYAQAGALGPGVQVHLITSAGSDPTRENLVTAPGGAVFGADSDVREPKFAQSPAADSRLSSGDLNTPSSLWSGQLDKNKSAGTTGFLAEPMALTNTGLEGGVVIPSEQELKRRYNEIGQPDTDEREEFSLLVAMQRYIQARQGKAGRAGRVRGFETALKRLTLRGGKNRGFAYGVLNQLKAVKKSWVVH